MGLAVMAMLLGGSTGVFAAADYLGHVRQGTDLLRRDLGRQAEQEFGAANSDDYVDPLAWIGLGASGLAQGRIEGALSRFERAVELAAAGSPQAQTAVPVARFGRAVCLLQRGQVRAGREELARLARDGLPWVLPTLAYADLAAGDKAAARGRAEAALECYPTDALAMAVLGRTLAEGEGIARLRKAVAACPGSPYAAPLTGLALPNRGRPGAEKDLIRVDIKEASPRRAIMTWLGDGSPDHLLLRVDGVTLAMSNTPPHEFTLPRKLAPGPHGVVAEAWSGGMLIGRGGTVLWLPAQGPPGNLYDDGEYAAALAGLRAALTPMPNRVHVHYWLAGAYAATGNRAAALHSYERVVALDAGFADARQRLVELCAATGRTGSARAIQEVPGRWVCLTFDDGPHPMFTGQILDLLREAGVGATFFVVGTQARAHPELLRAIAAAGHEIANHSYSHDDMTTKTTAELQQELLRTQVVVQDVIGKRPRLFRPPGGRHNAQVRAAGAQVGYTTVMWSADVGVCAGISTERGLQRLLADIRPGAIVLLHNGPDETMHILPGLLAALKKRGYKFGTL
jgi:peptidoglycan/xylan/chitin deacetylase (PgdA/CDA1 family)